jgi:uncharacterized Ntn-hydrolase superfamily protein
MNKFYYVISILFTQIVGAQTYKNTEPFIHTYSIVARDSLTGDMAVAVQSHYFNVGSVVTYGKAGVGVVATQSLVNPSYGPKGLALMEQGLSPKQALNALIQNDQGEMYRQVAFLNADGDVATHTGQLCIAEAGHVQGRNFSVQANMMLHNTVWNAMANAFRNTNGDLSQRIIEALKAAEKEQGDIRGKQSAAILIVSAKATGNPFEDNIMDLRVEDHENPVQELERLIKIHTAYVYMNKGDLAMEEGNSKEAEKLYLSAQNLFPENLEMQFWYAINLLNNKEFEKAKPILKSIFSKEINWKKLIPRLVKSKLLTITDDELASIMRF